MFRIVGQFQDFLFIQSENECMIFPSGTVERARKRFKRKANLRKPITLYIHEQCFVFTEKEWKRGQNFALAFQIRFSQCDIFKVYQWDKIGRHKNRLYQQKMISLRARIKANAAAFEKNMKDIGHYNRC